jgi:cyanate lyase
MVLQQRLPDALHRRWRHFVRAKPVRTATTSVLPLGALQERRFFTHNKDNTMDRNEVTKKILTAKVKNKMTWAQIADKIGNSKEWTTAAMLGQMTFNAQQAALTKELFNLTDEETAWLQIVPYKGSLPTPVPTDPLIYRWYEIVSVYGTTIKELIHEEFGDGIMSAIDFSMDIQRQADPKGDRVNVVLSGKFLPYKEY